jgi:conjugal transfer/type IV secretion protein DotA/TraY
MPDLKTLLSFLLGLFLLIPLQAAADGVPSPSDYGNLFGTVTGDAYSSILLNEMFGPLFPSAALPEGDAGARTVFSSIIGYFNVIILVVGGLMFFYNVTVGVLQSAHEGQVLGQRWSSLWAPLRVLFAVGLLVPVPNYGGYNLAQVGVAYVVKGSTNIASEIWKGSVNLILDGDIPIATSESRFSPDNIRVLYENAACMNLLNYQFIAIGSPKRVVYSDPSAPVEAQISMNDFGDGTFPRYASTTQVVGGGRTESAGICGSWYTPDLPAYLLRVIDENGPESAATQAIISRFAEGHRDILIEVERRVRALATGTGDAQPVRQDVFESILEPTPFTAELQAISVWANNAQAQLVTQLRDQAQAAGGQSAYDNLRARITGSCTEDASGPDAQPAACYGEGWIGAGAYYTTLARVNAEINSLTTAQPTVMGRTFMTGAGLTQDQFVDVAGGGGLLWGRNAAGEQLPSDEEAERVLTRYNELYATSSYPLAALGFSMSVDDIVDANAEAGASSEGFIASALRSLNEAVQRAQAGLLSFFDPANSVGQDPMIGLISTGGMLITLGFGILVASMIGVRVAVVMVPFFSVIFAAGATLSFVLPLMPFFYWILGVTGYFLLVVEAIVAVNLWALAHMRMDGDGISGMAGQKGWLMLLALLMTPVLMVFGFLIGMAIFRISSNLISAGMFYAVSGISGGANPIVALIGILAFSIMIVTAYIFLLERSFSLISEFPNRVMMWMGEGIQIGGGEDRIRAAAAGAAVGTNALGNQMEKPFQMRPTADGSMRLSRAQEGFKTAVSRIPGMSPSATDGGGGGGAGGGAAPGPDGGGGGASAPGPQPRRSTPKPPGN